MYIHVFTYIPWAMVQGMGMVQLVVPYDALPHLSVRLLQAQMWPP